MRSRRILIVDDPGIMRDALCALLAREDGFEVVDAVSTGKEALRALASLQPDVVLIDFTTTMVHGPGLIAIIRERRQHVRVLVLTLHREDHFISASLQAGADGYLLKTDSSADLITAIRSIATGRPHISAAIQTRTADGRPKLRPSANRRQAPHAELTPRQQQVIRLIAQGYRTRDIAQSLSLSYKTVEKHRSSLMRKLGLRTAAAVAAYVIAEDFVSR